VPGKIHSKDKPRLLRGGVRARLRAPAPPTLRSRIANTNHDYIINIKLLTFSPPTRLSSYATVNQSILPILGVDTYAEQTSSVNSVSSSLHSSSYKQCWFLFPSNSGYGDESQEEKGQYILHSTCTSVWLPVHCTCTLHCSYTRPLYYGGWKVPKILSSHYVV